ncbi:hypothetical protein F2Q65_12510 [Thiohalocapsa marina]|uniref:Cyanovirin-N domain-containing protein n=1 Tax=Thiohalocapsa marina TaxID=424902 RepID=A0A5M8FIT5_9GAMM|nr:CVNH domain-containing protein [Thiohalocapsa marina]KAA6184394.1 hypothetical protein F2Q65_12510 [Thiohalocapsa marina]
MKKMALVGLVLLPGHLLAAWFPVANLQQTCTAFDLKEGVRLEAFCVERPTFRPRDPANYPISMMRRTSIDLDQCVGEDPDGNLVFGGRDFSSQCHSIGFNQTPVGPMLYATCRSDAGVEVDSIPLNLSRGLSSQDGQLTCSSAN